MYECSNHLSPCLMHLPRLLDYNSKSLFFDVSLTGLSCCHLYVQPVFENFFIFFIFLDCFNMLILNINFLKNIYIYIYIYYFDIFSSKKHFKKQLLTYFQTDSERLCFYVKNTFLKIFNFSFFNCSFILNCFNLLVLKINFKKLLF
jgi:hypothetical protein